LFIFFGNIVIEFTDFVLIQVFSVLCRVVVVFLYSGCVVFANGGGVNLHQLRFIREAVRQNFSLTQAAHVLFTSQPGISKAIIELEEELGVQIFQRHGKRIKALTAPGRLVVSCAEKILAELENMKRIGAEYAARSTGELRIAATHTQARYSLPPVVAAFRQRYPQVRLVILQGVPQQLVQWVTADQADLAIATEALASCADMVTFPCFDWQHVVVAPLGHAILQNSLTLDALADQPLITYEKAFAGRAKIDAAFQAVGATPKIVLEAIDADVIKTYVGLGLGIGVIANIAFDAQKDQGLTALPAGVLFGTNTVRIGVRQGVFMRHLMYEFIQMFAPQLNVGLIDRALQGGEDYSI
jgi:LysR family cys regulon transcriptional activator